MAIGNPLLDKLIQWPTIIEYAYVHHMISLATKIRAENEWKACKDKVSKRVHQQSVFDVRMSGGACAS